MKVEEAPGGSIPFSLEPILVELEGGRYTIPILSASLADLTTGRQIEGGSAQKGGGDGGSSGGGGGSNGGGGGISSKRPLPKVAATEGSARVRVGYDADLPVLFLRDGENSRSILMGAFLPTLCGHILCKNWHICGV